MYSRTGVTVGMMIRACPWRRAALPASGVWDRRPAARAPTVTQVRELWYSIYCAVRVRGIYNYIVNYFFAFARKDGKRYLHISVDKSKTTNNKRYTYIIHLKSYNLDN